MLPWALYRGDGSCSLVRCVRIYPGSDQLFGGALEDTFGLLYIMHQDIRLMICGRYQGVVARSLSIVTSTYSHHEFYVLIFVLMHIES
ncbi:hypothetical protein ANAPH1_00315 [Anaplasma phagocytophilum]|nr:hypothetical protein ANAPH1_00315 [Anaplasma phagocytophilum]SCV66193.1 hypothetical protein ANAPH2_01510 [Anaplasma phagocytophilum]